MSKYTYAEFENAAKQSGYYERMNPEDISLAQKNPDAGMSLLSAIQDWNNATTAEGKALAHSQAEKVRKTYGGYSGGEDGSEYISTGTAVKPGYSNSYKTAVDDAVNAVTSYGSYESKNTKPTYQNAYTEQLDAALKDVNDRGDYEYNPDNSALTSAIKKSYMKAIDRTTEDTMAAAAAQTGGRASSYAATAAAQAGNAAAADFADKQLAIAQAEQQIYAANFNQALNKLSAVQAAEQNDYSKYQDALSQYNTEEATDRAQWEAEYNRLVSNAGLKQSQQAQELSEYQIDLAQYNTETEQALQNAIYAAQYGDYSQLEALGIDTDAYQTSAAYQSAVEAAELQAKYGDYTGLASLGIDATAYAEQQAAANAKTAAETAYYNARANKYNADASSGGSGDNIVEDTSLSQKEKLAALQYLYENDTKNTESYLEQMRELVNGGSESGTEENGSDADDEGLVNSAVDYIALNFRNSKTFNNDVANYVENLDVSDKVKEKILDRLGL